MTLIEFLIDIAYSELDTIVEWHNIVKIPNSNKRKIKFAIANQ